MHNLTIKETFTSLELVELINQFRGQEGNRKELQHKTFLETIRNEFEKEINEQKILPIEYKDAKGEKRPMYTLNLKQSRQVLVRESKFVRKAVIEYIDRLEQELQNNLLPKDYLSALKQLVESVEENQKLLQVTKEQEEELEKQKPKVLFADAVASSQTSILVGDLAKILKQNGINTGQKRLFEELRNKGFLMKEGASRNMPTQRAMELGLFEIKETTINNPDGSIRVTKTPKVTGKGQQYLINTFLKH